MLPVILSGGSGTRLWPVSRSAYPTQFCEFYDQSFLLNTISRVKSLGNPYVLTVAGMEALTQRALREVQVPVDHALFEPMGRNTAPAIALICHFLKSKGLEEEVIGIFPADHLIAKENKFLDAVHLANEAAQKGEIVTLGIKPRYAATGYGYIEVRDYVFMEDGALKAHMVKGFREKPDPATAEEFASSGSHYWNSGMFIFRVDVMIEALKTHMPDVWDKITNIKPDLSDAKYHYANLESQSIDYGVMEKLDRLICIPCEIGWSDVGSWDEMARLEEDMPELPVRSKAHVFPHESSGNYVFSVRDKTIGLIDVNNLVVVDTPDALLISQKGSSEKVKDLVQEVKKANSQVVSEHPFEWRPWGGFEILADEEKYKAKKIRVDAGEQLSYQMHKKRSEHWTIIEGDAEVILDDEPHKLEAGDHIHIPKGSKHRIRNVGATPLVFVEVQTGTYFGEDDIVRFQDDYNRV